MVKVLRRGIRKESGNTIRVLRSGQGQTLLAQPGQLCRDISGAPATSQDYGKDYTRLFQG